MNSERHTEASGIEKPEHTGSVVLEALRGIDVREQASRRPAEPSRGRRQMVTVAGAGVNRPAIVWAGAPAGNPDATTAQRIDGPMRRLNRENGHTFVIVTHAPQNGQQTDRIIWMKDGRVVDTLQIAGVAAAAGTFSVVCQNNSRRVRRPEYRIAIEPIT